MLNLGAVPAGTVLYIPFASYNAAGASVTLTGLAVTDVEIYKNGSTTQRASDNGYTLLDTDGIDFDGVTGLHGFSIDLSDNTDSGFYAVGSWYWVIVSTVTVDSQTVTFIAAVFRIAPAEATAGYPVTTHKVGTGTGELNSSSGKVPATIAAGDLAANCITASAIADNAIDAGAIASDAITSAKVADGFITAAKLASDCITAAKIANGAIDAATFAADVDAEFLSYLVDDATRIDASALNTLSGHDPGETIMGATDLGTGAGLTTLATQASVNSLNNFSTTDLNDRIVAYGLDHLVAVATSGGEVANNSIIARLANSGATAVFDSFDNTMDSLQAIRDRGDAAWITATGFSTHSASDVWAVGTRVLTAGTNIVLAKGTGITGFNDLSAAQVNAEADTALADAGVTTTVTGRIDAAISTRSSQSSLDTVDGIVDAILLDTGTDGVVVASGSKTGYSLTQPFPSNFSSLGINASGHVSRVTLVDTTTTNTDMRGTDNALLASGYTAPANASIAAIKTETDKLADTLEDQGGGTYGFTAEALQEAPAGGGGSGPTAVEIRQEIDSNSTKLDVAVGTRLATSGYTVPPTANQNAAAILAAGDVDGYTLEQTLKLCLSALAGKLSGAGTSTVTIRAADDSKARITATVDSDGNRSTITLDAAG